MSLNFFSKSTSADPLPTHPEFVLYALHGFADTNYEIMKLAHTLAQQQAVVIAPNLPWLDTWIRIEPLIQTVETLVMRTIAEYPDTPMRMIGHSMGGLIWLEVLHRHPEWWTLVHSLALVGSPVGGSHYGRIIDNFATGIGIAQDLGVDRREIAEEIASIIPTLSIAGDWDKGSDGTVTLENSKFKHANFLVIPKLHHAAMRNHPAVANAIRQFWLNPKVYETPSDEEISTQLIKFLRSLPGLTDGHPRDFHRASVYHTFQNGYTLRTWRNPFQVDHVFIGDRKGKCIYSGFVLWKDTVTFQKLLVKAKSLFE